MKTKILLVDDDPNIRQLVNLYLEKEGFEVLMADRGDEAVKVFKTTPPNLILLDLMLPGMDGWQVCREVRKVSNIPIIMLTAKGTVDDKLYGLEAGADDYITKPFDLREVIARVKTVLRRFEKADLGGSAASPEQIVVGSLVIRENERTVLKAGQEVDLTPKEYDLFLYFIKHPRQVFTRLVLLEQIWGYDYLGDTRTVDIHVQRLRKKLDLSGSLQTVFGVGYKYVPQKA